MLELGTATTQLINSGDVNLNWKNQLIYQHVLACMYVRYKARKISDIGCAHLWKFIPVSLRFLDRESIKCGNFSNKSLLCWKKIGFFSGKYNLTCLQQTNEHINDRKISQKWLFVQLVAIIAASKEMWHKRVCYAMDISIETSMAMHRVYQGSKRRIDRRSYYAM